MMWVNGATDWSEMQRRWEETKKSKDAPHCGDCTKEPQACDRCLYEEVIEFVTRVWGRVIETENR